jgi:hypothetical protein
MMLVFRPVVFVALLSSSVAVQADETAAIGAAGQWLPEMIQTVTTGCEQTLLHDAVEGYRQLHELRRTQLPKDLAQRLRSELAPQFAVCACITKKIAARWDFAYFMDNQAALAPEIQQYVKSGECTAAGAPVE